MCGIAGIVSLNKEPLKETILSEMLSVLKHRGPDDGGVYIQDHCGLGHVRLSIIDLTSEAGQPMRNEDSSVILVHNGEIYNYLELRQELIFLGHKFRSRSDTEVILHAYEEWGESCLGRFNGMWAFAIIDKRRKEIFCSRDRFGVKPFYYYIDKDIFVFASEIKALLKHPAIRIIPNDAAVFNYLSSGYGYMDVSDDTFFARIKQLRPAHYLRLSLVTGELKQARFWDLDPGKRSAFSGKEDAYNRFYELFEDSVRLRLRSDVPLGISLSGGLDSSAIACVTSRLMKGERFQTFSSCYDEPEYDERRYIEPVLKKTSGVPNYIFTRPEDLFSDMEDILWHQDEPYSTLSIFPQWNIMKCAREKGIKVLLSGQGGDETLAGYHKYYYYYFADLLFKLQFGNAAREMRFYWDMNSNGGDTMKKVARIMLSSVTPRIFKDTICSRTKECLPGYLNKDFVTHDRGRVRTERRFSSILNNDLYNAMKVSPLPSLLHIDDRSSMAHSVETRSPFLDYRLVEYLFSLGPEYKIREGVTKYILRRALKGVLPEEVRTRRDKMGFATPLEKWFKTVLKDKVRGIFSSNEFKSRPYFDNKGVMKKFDDYLNGKDRNGHYTIWSWVNLELWMRKFIDA